jgi:tetratricopeptide (TPR) repeat protein
LARLLHHLSDAYQKLGDKDKGRLTSALEASQASWKTYRKLADEEPRSAEPVYGMAGALFDTGLVTAKMDRKKESVQAYQSASTHLRRLLKVAPDNLDYRHLLGLTLNNLGHEQWLLQRREEAFANFREGLEHNRFVFVRMPERLHRRQVLYTTYVYLSEAYRETGQREELIAVLRARRELWLNNGNELFIIAGEMARAKDDDEAIRTLKQAIAKGFKDFPRLEKEPALTSLRQRPEFAEWLRRIKASN